MTTELWAIVLVLLSTAIGSFGPIFLKKGSRNFFNLDLALGFGFYGISLILFIISLKGGELSILYPLGAIGYVFVALLSMRYFDEKMNKYKWFGISMIILGIIFISQAA